MSKRRKKVNWKNLSVDVVTKISAFYDTFKELEKDQQKMILKILGSVTT